MSGNSKYKPLFSIVMPSYNHAIFIKHAVSSVLQQTYDNWELIIVDNYSTDETLEVLNEFHDERIKILQIDNGGSVAKSRNLGVATARAPWIAFLDSDDLWQPSKLEKIIPYLNSKHDLLYHHLNLIQESTDLSKHGHIISRKLNSPVLKDLIIKGNTIATSSVVIRKEIFLEVGGMSENLDLIGIEDYNTWLRISKKTEKFSLVPFYLGYYRIHSANLSSSNQLKPPIAAIEEFLPLLEPSEIRKMNSNFAYVKLRTEFLKSGSVRINPDLLEILGKGRLFQKIKALWMLIASLVRIKKSL